MSSYTSRKMSGFPLNPEDQRKEDIGVSQIIEELKVKYKDDDQKISDKDLRKKAGNIYFQKQLKAEKEANAKQLKAIRAQFNWLLGEEKEESKKKEKMYFWIMIFFLVVFVLLIIIIPTLISGGCITMNSS